MQNDRVQLLLMKIQGKNNRHQYVLLGVNETQYLVHAIHSNLYDWMDQSKFENLNRLPDYLEVDPIKPEQKVVHIFKSEYDLDFYVGKLEWNESLTPLYYKQKRLAIALNTIGEEHDKIPYKGYLHDDTFYFAALVGKFETINEIIDASLKEEEAYNLFDWSMLRLEDLIDVESVNNGFEPLQYDQKKFEHNIISFCKFVSDKIITNGYAPMLFTDLYGAWKTFLLGNDFQAKIDINIKGTLEPKFKCHFKDETHYYYFDYAFFLC